MTAKESDVHEILVHRSNLKNDMLNEFNSNEVLTKNVQFGIVGHNGKLEEGMGNGVNKEVFAAFFEEFYSSCCCGVEELVPILRHDMHRFEWEAVARIICYSTKEKYFPIRLSYALMKSAFSNEDSVKETELLASFLKIAARDGRETLERNLEEMDANNDKHLDVLLAYNCHSLPTKENLKEIIIQLAHKEIIQKPRYVVQAWNNIFNVVKFQTHFLRYKLEDIYKNALPTGGPFLCCSVFGSRKTML